MNNKGLITILIIIIAVLTIALIGAIVYIVTNNSKSNTPIIVNNYSKNDTISNQTETSNITKENTVTNDVLDSNENNEVNNNEVDTNIPNNENEENTSNTNTSTDAQEPQDNIITPTQPPEEDMEKLLFNSDIIAFLGQVKGEQIQQLLDILDKSNYNNPNHQIKISSNTISGPDEIVETEKYVVTLNYNNGYICTVNIDKK